MQAFGRIKVVDFWANSNDYKSTFVPLRHAYESRYPVPLKVTGFQPTRVNNKL
jgi:hypothetical protein